MDVKSGLSIGDCRPRHRAREFLAFLKRIDQIVSRARRARRLLDPEDGRGQGVARETSALQAALHADERLMADNLVERCFAEITHKRIRERRIVGSRDLQLCPAPQRRSEGIRVD
jgi:hypothetical protein